MKLKLACADFTFPLLSHDKSLDLVAMLGFQGVDIAVEPLIPYASHFHVRGARKGRLQTSFKENVIDYRRVLEAMKRAGYRGYLGIEYVWIDWEHCNEADNLSETILFRDFLLSA